MTNNADMPAMPLSGDAYQDFAGFDGTKNTSYNPQCQGLTKRETFAMNAPIMPHWFEMVFINDDTLNKGVNYMQHNNESREMWVGEDGKPAMFIAWSLYYADALLDALEQTK